MEEKRCRRRSSITDAAIPDVEELEELHCPPSLAQAPHKLVGRWIIAETFGLGLTLSFQKELWSLFYDSHHVVAFTTGERRVLLKRKKNLRMNDGLRFKVLSVVEAKALREKQRLSEQRALREQLSAVETALWTASSSSDSHEERHSDGGALDGADKQCHANDDAFTMTNPSRIEAVCDEAIPEEACDEDPEATDTHSSGTSVSSVGGNDDEKSFEGAIEAPRAGEPEEREKSSTLRNERVVLERATSAHVALTRTLEQDVQQFEEQLRCHSPLASSSASLAQRDDEEDISEVIKAQFQCMQSELHCINADLEVAIEANENERLNTAGTLSAPRIELLQKHQNDLSAAKGVAEEASEVLKQQTQILKLAVTSPKSKGAASAAPTVSKSDHTEHDNNPRHQLETENATLREKLKALEDQNAALLQMKNAHAEYNRIRDATKSFQRDVAVHLRGISLQRTDCSPPKTIETFTRDGQKEVGTEVGLSSSSKGEGPGTLPPKSMQVLSPQKAARSMAVIERPRLRAFPFATSPPHARDAKIHRAASRGRDRSSDRRDIRGRSIDRLALLTKKTAILEAGKRRLNDAEEQLAYALRSQSLSLSRPGGSAKVTNATDTTTAQEHEAVTRAEGHIRELSKQLQEVRRMLVREISLTLMRRLLCFSTTITRRMPP